MAADPEVQTTAEGLRSSRHIPMAVKAAERSSGTATQLNQGSAWKAMIKGALRLPGEITTFLQRCAFKMATISLPAALSELSFDNLSIFLITKRHAKLSLQFLRFRILRMEAYEHLTPYFRSQY